MITLYIKTHNKTGLKYFGMHKGKDVFSYRGSGKYWCNHLKKHGNDVSTEVIGEFFDQNWCLLYALEFSEINNIVGSSEWANLKIECLDGGWDFVNSNGLNGASLPSHKERAKLGGIATRKAMKGIHRLSKEERARSLFKDGIHIQKRPEIRKKLRSTNLSRYGNEIYLASEEGKAKIRSSSIERYGVENVMQSEEVRVKYTESLMAKYGVENVSKLQGVKDKKKASSIAKFGVSCNLNTPEKIQERKEVQTKLRNRKIVKDLEALRDEHKIKLPRNYPLKKDEVLFELYEKLKTL